MTKSRDTHFYKLVKKLIILDQSQEMLNNLEYNEIIKIKQDARNMSKIKDHSVDIILIIFAGTPAITTLLGNSPFTTEPAPT